MDVRFNHELGLFCKSILTKEFEVDPETIDDKWRSDFRVDLASFGMPAIKKLRAHLASAVKVPGANSLYKDINAWVFVNESKEGIKAQKARTVRQAVSLMIEYFKRYNPRKHIYEREQDGNEGVTVCYFVDEIKFIEKEKRQYGNTPEHMTIDFVYREFGKIGTSSTSFWPEDCLGKTAKEILLDKDLMIETEMLREDYEFLMERYDAEYDKVGKQFLASGVADDQNIDGNEKDDDRWWYRSKTTKMKLDKDGEPSRVVIDIFQEKEDDKERKDDGYNRYFWNRQTNITYNERGESRLSLPDDDDADESADDQDIEIPTHPYVACFDLKRHKRLRIHIGNLEEYVYDTSIRDKLVLPETHAGLIDTLLIETESHFKDIIKGKTGGMLIICQGPPGTGKTLTAEVYAEGLQRPLYTIQCAQLGVDPDALESNLMKVLARGRRWGAVMLLDEADVYVHERGNDLNQNAIVGVFLRVLEYQSGVLFMTTNRGDLVDDAILSRCTARIPYGVPTKKHQIKIWEVMAEANGLDLSKEQIKDIVGVHNNLSGRDIKNLLKLAALVAHDRECEIDSGLISEMRTFKPTFTEYKGDKA